ncbi:glycosyltransferase family 2 protein [Priestia flexa]|uniref:glycosyltransferase family 2 protein n=1 Tax=Priestia flexa TaxID=86664 RepID=UPI0013D1D6FC|nr:glycosyltransferase family 2 protein [Priestia flexa]
MEVSKTAVIIPNWNGWKDTIECLDSLKKAKSKDLFDVIVVDNNSTDDSIDRITEWGRTNYLNNFFLNIDINNKALVNIEEHNLILISNNINKGFAAALNKGAKYILSFSHYKYVWFLNNDTVVDEAAIIELINYAEMNNQLGMIGNLIMEYSDRNVVQCMGGSKYNILTSLNTPYMNGEKIIDVQGAKLSNKISYICGASMFMKTSTFHEVGYFNEDYFLYYEELDYTRRMNKKGYKIGFSSSSIIYHKGGSSAGSKSKYNTSKSSLSEYYSNLSALKFTKSFHPAIFPLFFINRYLMKIAYLLIKRNFTLIKSLNKAYYDFLTNKKLS